MVGSLTDLSKLAGLAMGLGVAGVRTMLDQHNELRELQQGNQLYFYYGARELLRNPEQGA